MRGWVYLCGPMRGKTLLNFPAFEEAKQRLERSGWNVASPVEIDKALGLQGYSPKSAFENDEFLRRAMKLDLTLIEHCEAIALLPGWEDSAGCTVELAYALFLSLDVYDAMTMEHIQPKSKPWEVLRRDQMFEEWA